MLTLEEKKQCHKEVFSLAIHSSLQELFAVFANILNSLLLCKIGQAYLSATSLAGQFVSIYIYSTLGLTLAVLMLLTQYFGKNDLESVKKILHISTLFSFILSVVFFLSSFLFPHQIMCLLTNDTELIDIGTVYLKYYSFVFLFSAFSKIYMTVLKAMGKAKTNTIINVISISINFLASFVLIFGFITGKPLYALGAALASCISSLVECLLFFFHCTFFGKVKFSLIDLFNTDIYFAKEIFRYSLPSIFTKFAWSSAYTILCAYIGHMSREIIDAFAFIKIFANVPNAFLSGFGIAFGIVIGHELGKGNTRKAKLYGDDGIKYTVKIAIIASIMTIALGFAATFINKTINPSAVNTYAFLCMTLVYAYQYFGGTFINYFNNGPFTAGGEVEFLALVDVVNMWCVMVPIGYILCNLLKVPEYLSLIFIYSSEYTKFLPVYRHYKKYVWARDLTVNQWFLPLEGSFIDKYKRSLKLRFNISISELFTKRFENSTDFIFSLKKENYNTALEELHAYLKKMDIDDTTIYKTVLAMEEIYTSSRFLKETEKGGNCHFNCDIGVKLKDNKVRFIYYDDGLNLHSLFNDKTKTNIQVLTSIADKLEYKRYLTLNKILIRINKK